MHRHGNVSVMQQRAWLRARRARLCALPLAVCASALVMASCSHRAAPPAPYLAFVAGAESSDVAALNLATFKRVRTIPLGFPPAEILPRPHHHQLVAAGNGKLAVIAFPGLVVKQTIGLPHGSASVVFSSDGGRAYVASGDTISVFDCVRWTLLKQFRLRGSIRRMMLALDGGTLVGEDVAGSRLVFIRAADGAALGSVPLGRDPGDMVPVRSKVFVANPAGHTVTAIDVASHAVLSQIETAGSPDVLALKPDGGELFAMSAADSRITILDTEHDNVEQSLPAGESPAAAIFTPDSSTLYIANAGDGTVSSLDVSTRKVTGCVRVGVQPEALALTPDGRFLVAADRAGGNLAVLRAHPLSLITTIPVGPEPSMVVVPGWTAAAH